MDPLKLYPIATMIEHPSTPAVAAGAAAPQDVERKVEKSGGWYSLVYRDLLLFLYAKELIH